MDLDVFLILSSTKLSFFSLKKIRLYFVYIDSLINIYCQIKKTLLVVNYDNIEVFMYKKLVLPALALCAFSFLFSVENNDKLISMGNLDNPMKVKKATLTNRVQALEDQLQDKTKLVDSKNQMYGFLNLELLCWRADQTVWNYATTSAGTITVGTITNITGSPDWKPGCRLELGFSLPYNWNISAMWTHHRAKSHSSYSNENGLIGHGLFLALDADTHFKTNYNIADLQLSSIFSVLKNIYINPEIGVRGAWIKCHQSDEYTGRYPTGSNLNVGTYNNIDKWYGYGPSFGMTSYYNFNRTGFSFFGGFSTALLYGSEHLKTIFDILNLRTGRESHLEIKQNDHQLKAHLQLVIGADMKWKFHQDKRAVSIHASWETNYWWHLGEKPPLEIITEGFIGIQPPPQDLTFSGVNVGIGFDY
jgi:hypothetical protein